LRHAGQHLRVSSLNKKIYCEIEAWRKQPIERNQPYLYLERIVLKRNWAGDAGRRAPPDGNSSHNLAAAGLRHLAAPAGRPNGISTCSSSSAMLK